MIQLDRDVRAVSPVIGTVLLLAIVVALVSVSGYVIYGATDTGEPAPEVALDLEQTDQRSEYKLVHETGDTLDGDSVELRGAADADALAGKRLTAGDTASFYPTQQTVHIVWYDDADTSYVLSEFEIANPLPSPDQGCDWVDDQTNGGSDPITIDGVVVDCDVQTSEQVKVQDGGVIVGEAISDSKDFDGDSSTVYGDIEVENVVNIQDGRVTGDATSRTADVKLGNATTEGSVTAEKVAEAADGSVVDGDVESRSKDSKILNSEVRGSVTADGIVKLDGATVDGDVYVDSTDFDCSDSTISGEDCSSYTPKPESEWE